MDTHKLTLGFSPCPNDTFMFDAMINQKIDTEGLSFDVTMADVEELNHLAFNNKLDITKLSYNAFAHLTNAYVLLDAGSALGENCGPLLISKKAIPNNPQTVSDLKIAIPGKYTTANFLLSLYAPKAVNKEAILFSDIESKVLDGTFDAGVIIHENRFTYHERGLHKIIDLGEFWQQLSNAPIPLGGIAAHRRLDGTVQERLNRVMRRSIEYAFANPEAVMPFVRQHAQEMSEEVMKKHIALYVNKYSLNLGLEGRQAILLMLNRASSLGLVTNMNPNIFITKDIS